MNAVVPAMLAALALTGCGPDSAPEPESISPPPSASPTADEANPFADLAQGELDRRLIAAAWDDDVPKARQLIDAGADVNAKDETEQSAYLIATSEGHLDLLELTLRNGAEVDSLDRFDGTGLIRAAERGHHDIVGRLLQTDIDVDHVNNLGWVALHEAIVLGDGRRRYVDTVRALVAGGANLEIAPQRDGISPLNHARRRGFDAIAATIERARKASSMTHEQANRTLLRAAGAGDADAAAIALRHGADIETRDQQGRTPLQLADVDDHAATERLLVGLGAGREAPADPP